MSMVTRDSSFTLVLHSHFRFSISKNLKNCNTIFTLIEKNPSNWPLVRLTRIYFDTTRTHGWGHFLRFLQLRSLLQGAESTMNVISLHTGQQSAISLALGI